MTRGSRIAASFAALVAALAAAPLPGCGGGEGPGGPPPPEVVVETARTGTVPDRREYVGNVRAINAVDVRARVRGYLTEQLYEDGQFVKEGQLLFRIDPRTYEVELAEAKGQLARARAAAERARRDFDRAQELVDTKVASVSVLDARRADRDASEAEISSAEAHARAAELNLSYTTMRAPIAGRIGRALVDVGNLVGESGQDTVLAHIVQTDPIHVDFAPTERDRLDVLRGAATGEQPAQRDVVPVNLLLGDGTPYPHAGRIDYVDPTVDPTRGTVAVRALLPNPDGVLKPGEFVRVVVVFPDVQNAVLVPQRAVLDQQGGTYVLVVKPDGAVEQRQVALGAAHQGLQQIADGLVSGEQVIVDGVQKARPGQKVVAKAAASETKAPAEAEAPAPATPGAAPAPLPAPPSGSPAARPSASAG
ncbi:MAG TPA: efflux RND transporter periplasmic adaptor subunit [Myxococcota bacterium]|nr:efflux RND transporter periplasmic adaptor subunit [Myxococcota bacterium]